MLELLRQCRRRTATHLGVAFASLWLVFAAVPCSAMEEFGIDLGHVHSAQTMTKAGHDCPHCPPAKATATPGDCVALDDAVITKVVQFDLTLAAPSALPQPAPIADAARDLAPPVRETDRPPAVPLNLRFCTFLE
jgi:hypothetical protein